MPYQCHRAGSIRLKHFHQLGNLPIYGVRRLERFEHPAGSREFTGHGCHRPGSTGAAVDDGHAERGDAVQAEVLGRAGGFQDRYIVTAPTGTRSIKS